MDRLLVALLRLGELLICSLPPRSVGPLAWTCGSLWYALDGRRRRRCRANLRAAFGADSAHATEAAVRAVFRSMARVPLEALWFPRIFRTEAQGWRRCAVRGDWDAFQACREEGGLLLGGHLGNWELGGQALQLIGVRISVVVRRFAQAGLERRLAASRGGRGVVIPHRTAVGGIRKAFAARRWVGVLGDQNAGWNAQFVPFFGLAASTAGAPVWLALEAGAPIFVGGVRRRPGAFRFELHLKRLALPETRDRRAAVATLLGEYMAVLETWIRDAPTQYNWLHRRWKSRPVGETPDPRLPVYDHHRVTDPAPSA